MIIIPTPHLTNEAQRQTPVQGYLEGYLIHMQRDPEAGPLALGPAPRPAETQGSGVGPLADLPTPHRLVSMTTETIILTLSQRILQKMVNSHKVPGLYKF